MENNRRYTTDELARELGLSRREVDRLRKTGKIPFLKVGADRGRFLYILSDVEEALSELAEQNKMAAATEYKQAVEANRLAFGR